MSKHVWLVTVLAIILSTFTAGQTLFAAKGSFAPEGTIGSQDNGGPGFQYRVPANKTANITGPIPSNDWWTGVLVRNDIATISPYPLIFAPCNVEGNGISIAFKGQGFVSAAAGGDIVGYSKNNWKISSAVQYDLVVFNSLADGTVKTKLDGYGDWHINLQSADNANHMMNTTIAAGSPYAYFSFANGNPKVFINDFDGNNIKFYTKDGTEVALTIGNTYTGDHLIVKLLDRRNKEPRWYGLFSAPGTTWKRDDAVRMSVQGSSAAYMTVGLLPNQGSATMNPADAALMYAHAYTKITGTTSDYEYDEANSVVKTTFNFTTTQLRTGTDIKSEVLTCLFPHQWKNLDGNYALVSGAANKTMRGTLKYFEGNSFGTSLVNHGILAMFNEPTESAGYDHAALVQYLRDEQYVRDYYNVDTYGAGKAMLRIAESIIMADRLGNPKISNYDPNQPDFYPKETFIDSLYNEFANWFTYSPGQEQTFWADNGPHHFMTYFSPSSGYYGQLTGWRAGFGAQALNDQHFHYGYWLHAAAILAYYKPSFVDDYGWAIEEIIRNIASPDRGDQKYPYMRYMNPYNGRSYAGGWYWDDNYQGNDQESTSEAMNAWAGLYLWGLVTGNQTYRDEGLYLYWTEKSAIDQYWLDVDNDVLHPDYPYTHAVILRETAYEFNTHWGSRQIEELYGIQVLPITAATLYFGLNQTYASNFFWQMANINKGINGGSLFDPANSSTGTAWDGVTLRMLGLINPLLALQNFTWGKIYGAPGASWSPLQDNETWASTYFFLHNMNQLGAPSKDYVADQPSFGVFKKGSQYNFVAFNPSKTTPMTVNFKNSSGQVVLTIPNVPPLQTVYAMNGSLSSYSSVSSSSVSSSSMSSSVISSSVPSSSSSSSVSSVISSVSSSVVSSQSSSSSSLVIPQPYTLDFATGGTAVFTLNTTDRKQVVHLFAKRNGLQDFDAINIQTTGETKTATGYAYTVSRLNAYTNGDAVSYRFYTYSAAKGQVFYPGPDVSAFTAPAVYTTSSSSSSSVNSSVSSSSSVSSITTGVVTMTEVAGGGMKFSITVPNQKSTVHLFARKNGAQDYAMTDIQNTGVNNGDGTFTYSVTRATGYVAGDKVDARFYTFNMTDGQKFYPGPAEGDFCAQVTYGGQSSSSSSVNSSVNSSVSSSLSSSASSQSVVTGVVTLDQQNGGGMKFSITLPSQKSTVHLFARKNGLQDYVMTDIQGTAVNNGNGTYTYSATRASGYVANDSVDARFYTFSQADGQIFYPGPAESVWCSPVVYGTIVSSSSSSAVSSVVSSSSVSSVISSSSSSVVTSSSSSASSQSTTSSSQGSQASSSISYGADGYGLVWSDEFEGTELDESKWAFDLGSKYDGWGNWELEYYTDKKDNVRTTNGELIIEAKRQAVNGYSFTSARIKTKGRMEFKYGKVEARIKMPNSGRGLWPAFWMLGANIDSTPWPKCGEIDIAEMGAKKELDAGIARKAVRSTTHWHITNANPSDGDHVDWGTIWTNDTEMDKDYYIYTTTWDEEYIRTYINGVQFYEMAINKTNTKAELEELHNPYFILLNLAVGGRYSGITDPNAIDMSDPQMKVDYVRVYQKEGQTIKIMKPEPVTGNFGVMTETTPVNQKLTFGSDAAMYIWSNLKITNGTPQEGVEDWLFEVPTTTNWFGAGVMAGTRDLTHYYNGKMHFYLKTTTTQGFKIGVKSADGGEAWIQFTNSSDTNYGLVRDGNWHEVVIPMYKFNGCDFKQFEQYFMIAGEKPNSTLKIEVDNIWFEEGAARPAPSGGNFGIYTETVATVDALDYANNADIQIWNGFTPSTGTPSEGNNVISFNGNGQWFGFGIAARQYYDLSAYSNGNLVFSMKTGSAAPFKLGMKSSTGLGLKESWIQFPAPGQDPYSFVRDNQWHQVKIPMSKFDSCKLSEMVQMFMLAGDPGAMNIQIDNIYIEP